MESHIAGKGSGETLGKTGFWFEGVNDTTEANDFGHWKRVPSNVSASIDTGISGTENGSIYAFNRCI